MESAGRAFWAGVKIVCVAIVLLSLIAQSLASATRGIFTEEIRRRIDGIEARIETLEQHSKEMTRHVEQNKAQVVIQAKQNERSIEDRIQMNDRLEQIEKAVKK